MSTRFFYALVMTIATVVLQLAMFFTGLQTEHLATGQYVQWLGIAIQAAVLWLGIRAVRDERPGQPLTFGQRLGAGVLISLYSGLMSAVYTFLHYKFINVNFPEYLIETLRAKWAAAGLAESQMAQAERMTRMMVAPGVQALLVPVFTVLTGTILSLVIAALLADRAKTTPDPQPSA